MSIKKAIIPALALLMLSLGMPQNTQAQWGIGASYEIRDEVPENGFGVRIERGFLEKIPVIDLNLRAHFSYFSEDNDVTVNNQTFSQEINDYDIGVAAIGGVSVGLAKPYVGLGIGSNTIDVSYSGTTALGDANESNFFWNALIGAEVSIIPKLKPFVEYRFTKVSEEAIQQQDVPSPSDSNGRIAFGLTLRF